MRVLWTFSYVLVNELRHFWNQNLQFSLILSQFTKYKISLSLQRLYPPPSPQLKTIKKFSKILYQIQEFLQVFSNFLSKVCWCNDVEGHFYIFNKIIVLPFSKVVLGHFLLSLKVRYREPCKKLEVC